MLDGIFVKQIKSIEELDDTLSHRVPQLLAGNPDVRLLIVDRYSQNFTQWPRRSRCRLYSIAFPFRFPLMEDDSAETYQRLGYVGHKLHALADEHQLIVIVTNQMTTTGGDEKVMIPALGDAWGHLPNVRIELKHNPDARTLKLTKSPVFVTKKNKCVDAANYCVTSGGIRDA